jgi:cytochrome c-type biogenesis protein CcmE
MTATQGSTMTATETMRRKTRLFMILAVAVALVGFAIIAASGINKNLVYYWAPKDLNAAGDKAYGATIRLGGMVAPGSIKSGAGSALDFDVTDYQQVVHVKASGLPPAMFREGIGVVVEGTMTKGGYFKGDRLMVSHNNEYRSPKDHANIDAEKLIKSTKGVK